MNTLIFALLGAGFVVAFFSGEGRVKKLAAGSLVGFLVATQLGEFVLVQLSKLSFVPEYSIGTIQIALLIAVTLLFNLGKVHHVEGRPRVSIESIAVALITMAFLFTGVLTFVGESTRSAWLDDYNLVALLYNWRLLILGLTAGGLLLVEIMGANTKKPR